MSETPVSKALEDSIPQASLESILCTGELQRRPSRPPDYEKENRAFVALVSALADSPSTIFQTLAETIHDITQCDSAGLSLLTRDGKTPHMDGQRFYWPAICGMWNPHVGGGTPRNFGPCGDVLDQNRTLLFRHFERRYPYLMPVAPAAEECLLVPFYVVGKAVGTIWAIMHSDRRKFDAEDDRIMASLGKFASSAYQAWTHIEDLKIQVSERERAEAALRMGRKLMEAQEQERARIGRELHDDVNQRLAMLAVELGQLPDDPAEMRTRVQELRNQTTELSNDVQALSHDLHSSKLEYLGAVAGIKSWCKEFGKRQEMEIDFKSNVSNVLPPEVGVCLFRVLQESLHNAVKHSGVKHVGVQLREVPNEIHLIVTDLGRGFDVEAAIRGQGLGLTSMQERVRLLNGSIDIQSKPMSGTTVRVRVPLGAEQVSERAAG